MSSFMVKTFNFYTFMKGTFLPQQTQILLILLHHIHHCILWLYVGKTIIIENRINRERERERERGRERVRARERWFTCNNNLNPRMFLIGPNDGGCFVPHDPLMNSEKSWKSFKLAQCIFIYYFKAQIINLLKT